MENAWTGNHVRLRTPEPRDAEAMSRWDADSDATRSGWYIPFPQSEEARHVHIATLGKLDGKDGNYVWIIETLDGEPAGTINVHGAAQQHGTFEYGISVARDHWGKGFAADALKLVLRYYFEELRYEKCDAIVYAFNERSQAFHRKFGFQEEGRIRGNRFTAGKRHDVFWFGITADEFFAKYGRSDL